MSRKITIIGAGSVGSTIAYSLSQEELASQIVMIDINKDKAEGEVMDIEQGTCFREPISIIAGDYPDAKDSDIVIITSGIARKPGQTRIDLAQTNVNILKSITPQIVKEAPNALYVIVSNPVDIMTRITAVLSGFNPRRVLGTGTALDTARLRYLLGAYFHVDPRNMHAYVMGEHGDSEFVPWSQAMMATKPVLSICEESHGRYCCEEMEKITEEVRGAAQKIIEAKRATYYGIGMALVRITRAIFGNENSVLTVSSMMRGEYGETGVFVGAPCIVNRNGVQRILQLSLNDEEMAQFKASCETLRTHFDELGLQ